MSTLSYSSRCALVVGLTRKLREHGSWCGETHLQKAMYILQDLAKASLGYKFIIYRHGPYSFELNNELGSMRASGILDLQIRRDGYGPSIVPTTFGGRVLEVNEGDIREFEPIIEFLAEWFSNSDVRQLEKLATAYFVTQKNPRSPVHERAKKLNSLKPHVDIHTAEEAVLIVDQKRELAKEKFGQLAA